MKKVERYIYIILIVILVGILSAGTTYIIMKNNDKTEIKENSNQNEEPTKQDGVKLLKTYNLNDKIIEEFEITLNGKTNNMKIEFDYDEDTEELNTHILSYLGGKLNNNLVLSYIAEYTTKNNLFNISKVKEKFNENNFKIIKGVDNKSYLLLITNAAYVTMYESELLIFNDNLEQIKGNFNTYWKSDSIIILNTSAGFKLENDIKPYYKNTFNIDFESNSDIDPNNIFPGVNVKIENNKIYYLALILDDPCPSGNVGIIEEREYTINNNKLEYKVINTYKVTEVVAGQVAC